jgi:hypothetical protein
MQPISRTKSAQDALGYRLFDIADPAPVLPAAGEMALPVPRDPWERR